MLMILLDYEKKQPRIWILHLEMPIAQSASLNPSHCIISDLGSDILKE